MKSIILLSIRGIVWTLYMLLPFFGFAHAGDSNPSKEDLRIQFLLQTDPKYIFASEGGGVVDGGGGNIHARHGQLLDRYQFSELQPLDVNDLKTSLLDFFGKRLEAIDQDLPGFKSWLLKGFEKTWFLDEAPFEKDFCSKVACQTKDSVYWQKQNYLSKNREELASMILAELLKRPLLDRQLSAAEVKTHVAAVLEKIRNSRFTSGQVYNDLRTRGFLKSPAELEHTRRTYVVTHAEALRTIRKNFDDLMKACETVPMQLDQSFKKALKEYETILEACRNMTKPEIDKGLCPQQDASDIAAEYRNSKCNRSPLL